MSRNNLNRIVFVMISLIVFIAFSHFASALGWNSTAVSTNYPLFEDTPVFYNFSVNVTDPVSGMIFVVNPDSEKPVKWNGTTVLYDLVSSWLFFNNTNEQNESTDGIFLLNATRDNETGNFSLPIEVSQGGTGSTATFNFNITPVNDAPQFITLSNQSFNRSEEFNYTIDITDEEDNTPFDLNITFLSCSVAAWSTRNCSGSYDNLTLFNISNSSEFTFNGTQINLSFVPSRNDVGNYTINFTITDAGNTTLPYNASTTQIVNFEVLNVNEYPYFTFVCDADQDVNATEDSLFECYINATDIDEYNYLNYSANYSWFNFSSSGNNTAQISGTENFSALLSLTPTDVAVGNWSVNISVNDTGSPQRTNFTTLHFYINNTPDAPVLSSISNIDPAYTSPSTINVTVTAYDDDLLIPDASVYSESLSFTSNQSVSNISFSNVQHASGTNFTNATMTINTAGLDAGLHTINVTVTDNSGMISSDVFTINISGNTAPQWVSNINNTLILTEDSLFTYDFSQNVSADPDGDDIDFYYIVENEADFGGTGFYNFNPDTATGQLTMTPRDVDVGYWNVTVIATDGKANSSYTFNFTVNNVPDLPQIFNVDTSTNTNLSVNWTGQTITTQEDNLSGFVIFVYDDDYLIQQPAFYDESLLAAANLTISPAGTTIIGFTFTTVEASNDHSANYSLIYSDEFTPAKADVGNYTIFFNVTDAINQSSTLTMNMTINSISHPPVLSNVSNQAVSILDDELYVDVNATDIEDGNDSASTNFTFALENLTVGGDFLNNAINSTTGVLNFTFNSTYAGLWQYNLSVHDQDGDYDWQYLNISVYDYPQIILPASTYNYSMKENQTFQLNFTANHTVADNLTYSLIISNITRQSISGYGNGSPLLWNFTPNFTDETCAGNINLTLNVSNAKLTNSTFWNLDISHTNYPLNFTGPIPNRTGGSAIVYSLDFEGGVLYFSDLDADDVCVNQTIGFISDLVNGSNTGEITATVSNWTNSTDPSINFSASDNNVNGTFWVTAFEYNVSSPSQVINNATSNNFTVTINSVEVEPTPTPTSGGGGGGSGQKIVSLKIIVPGPISAKQKDRIVVPISIVNDGTVALSGIDLSSYIAKDGILRSDLISSFDVSHFQTLYPGQHENLTMIVDIDTSSTGLFEVNINATVQDPKYSDWAKFFIQVEEEVDVLERIIFTEEFIIGNPQCAEFVDLINEAKALYGAGNAASAQAKAEEALDACKSAITQEPRARVYERIGDRFFTYAAIASLGAFVLGFAYYSYRKVKLRRQIYGYSTYQGPKTDKFY